MTGKPLSLGDVIAHKGEPQDGNPYRAGGLMGEERVAALRAWCDGSAEGFTFWYAPFGGGAERLGPDDWQRVTGFRHYFPTPEGA